MLRYILLSKSRLAVVDDKDFEKVENYKWHSCNGYATTSISGKEVYLHVMLMNPFEGEDVDHINHIKLDNRRCNLRVCSRSQNNANRYCYGGTSSYKGVMWDKERCKWRAYIKLNGRQKFLGRFSNEKEAAIAYDEAAKVMFGEFALLNFPFVSNTTVCNTYFKIASATQHVTKDEIANYTIKKAAEYHKYMKQRGY